MTSQEQREQEQTPQDGQQQPGDEDRSVGEHGRPLVVGLLAESTLPLKVLRGIAREVEVGLSQRVDSDCAWQVRVEKETLPVNPDGSVPLMERTEELQEKYGCDIIVYFTDLPHLDDGWPILADISFSKRTAYVSLPAMGRATQRRAHRTILRVVARIMHRRDELPSPDPRTERKDRRQPVIDSGPDVSGDRSTIQLSKWVGHWRLLVGMVRVNRPWRLAPALSGATAAATATGAFGVFYSSIWAMADTLSFLRLGVISVSVIILMSAWLIGYNGLWERRETARAAMIYNVTTVVTVGTAVTIMYLTLFVLILIGALTVITPDYLSERIGSEAGFGNYLSLSWLSASMGMVAGALGSSMDTDEDVRNATFGRREAERRALASEQPHSEEADMGKPDA